MSQTIVLQSQGRQDLGFILMSGGPDSGDCLIRPVPTLLRTSDGPELQRLDALKRLGECQWRDVGGATMITAPNGETVGELRGGTFITGGCSLVAFYSGNRT